MEQVKAMEWDNKIFMLSSITFIEQMNSYVSKIHFIGGKEKEVQVEYGKIKSQILKNKSVKSWNIIQ